MKTIEPHHLDLAAIVFEVFHAYPLVRLFIQTTVSCKHEILLLCSRHERCAFYLRYFKIVLLLSYYKHDNLVLVGLWMPFQWGLD